MRNTFLRKTIMALVSLSISILLIGQLFPQAKPNDEDDMDERMQMYNKALGVNCAYCHVEDDEAKWTRNKLVAKYMRTEFTDKFEVMENGKKVKLTCIYCHKGKTKTIDRTPPPKSNGGPGGGGNYGPNGNKMWNVMQMAQKGLGVNCSYCHESMHWTADNGRKKTTRTMLKDYCVNFFKKDGGQKLTCIDCHKGKPTFLPTEQDAAQKNNSGKKK